MVYSVMVVKSCFSSFRPSQTQDLQAFDPGHMVQGAIAVWLHHIIHDLAVFRMTDILS